MNACDEQSSNILLYLDNELSGQDLEDFRVHLAGCDSCRAQLAEENELSGLLHRARPLYSAPEGLRARVSATQQVPLFGSASERLRKRVVRLLQVPLGGIQSPAFPLRALAAVLLIVAGVFLLSRFDRHARATAYVDAALAAHRSYLDGALPLEIRSDSPQTVTSWFSGKVPFDFRLPASQSLPDSQAPYRQVGARLVSFRGSYAALVTYAMKKDQISLLVASTNSAPSFGGQEIRSGALTFHCHSKAGFNVITWSNHGLTYALVSPAHSSARQSCLVCHQNMADKNNFQEQ